MITNDVSTCPKCGGDLKYYDRVTRIVRTKGRKTWKIPMRRLQCTRCGSVHRELPELIFPYKQYEAEVIIGVLEGFITCETIGFEDYPMAKYIQLLAAQMGKKIPVPITVTNYIRLLASGGLGKSEKYLVDELQMMLSAMNVEAATVDCDCIEILRGQQKEGL